MTTTEEKIQTALLDLLKEKRIADVTIIAIANKSRINRTTVYRYYGDKYAILTAIEDNIFKELAKRDTIDPDSVSKILEGIDQHREIISVLLSENGDPRFYEYFIAYLTRKGLETIDSLPCFNNLDRRQKELLVQYISSALLGLIKYWLLHPEMTVEELDQFYIELFKNGIKSLTKQ